VLRTGQPELSGAQRAIILEHAELKKALAGPRIASLGPTISGFQPTAGAPGSTLTIHGTRLAGATLVHIGDTRIAISGTPGETSLAVVVPDDAKSGQVSVFTPLGVATSEEKFNVVETAKIGT
jgi:hypothetical protein